MTHAAFHDKATASVDSAVWRTFAWAGVALQAVALAAVLWLERWTGAVSLGAFFAASLAFLLMQERMPSLISFLVVIAAIINAFGWAWGLFHAFVWYDETVHLFTGFAGMAALSHVLWRRGWMPAPGTTRFVLKTALLGLGLGIAWELIEFLFLNLGWLDTVIDLAMDTLGAALAGWFTSWVVARRSLGAERMRG